MEMSATSTLSDWKKLLVDKRCILTVTETGKRKNSTRKKYLKAIEVIGKKEMETFSKR